MEHMAVFDTNILIDLFNNRVEAADAIDRTASHRAISLITWMEVMVAARKHGHEAKTAAVMGALRLLMCLGISQKEAFYFARNMG